MRWKVMYVEMILIKKAKHIVDVALTDISEEKPFVDAYEQILAVARS